MKSFYNKSLLNQGYGDESLDNYKYLIYVDDFTASSYFTDSLQILFSDIPGGELNQRWMRLWKILQRR